MLTRKHFKMVAETVCLIADPVQRYTIAKQHAAMFAKDNPRFNEVLFLNACHVSKPSPQVFEQA